MRIVAVILGAAIAFAIAHRRVQGQRVMVLAGSWAAILCSLCYWPQQNQLTIPPVMAVLSAQVGGKLTRWLWRAGRIGGPAQTAIIGVFFTCVVLTRRTFRELLSQAVHCSPTNPST